MPAIQKADPLARRRAIAIVMVAGAVLLGVIALVEINRASIGTWIENHSDELASNLDYVAMAFVLPLTPALFASAHLFFTGRRVARAKRFPVPIASTNEQCSPARAGYRGFTQVSDHASTQLEDWRSPRISAQG